MLDPLSVAIYSFIFLKIHGQDQMVYFSTVPSADWPRGVDARPSSPQRRTRTKVGGESSANLDNGDEDERMSYVHEKL